MNRDIPSHRDEHENLLISERSQLAERNSITNEQNNAAKNFFSQRAKSVDVISKKKSIPKILNQNVAAILDKYKLLDKTHTLTEPSEGTSVFESNFQGMSRQFTNPQNGNVSFSNPDLPTQFTSLFETNPNRNFSTVKTTASETNQSNLGTLNTLSNFESYKRKESLPVKPLMDRNGYQLEDHGTIGERVSMTARTGTDKENLRNSDLFLMNSMKLDKKLQNNGNFPANGKFLAFFLILSCE